MWNAVRGRLAFWGFLLTILLTLWVMAWNVDADARIRHGIYPSGPNHYLFLVQ